MSWGPRPKSTDCNGAATEGPTIPAMETAHGKPTNSNKARFSNKNKSTGAQQETSPLGLNAHSRRTGVGSKVQVPQHAKEGSDVRDHKHGAEGRNMTAPLPAINQALPTAGRAVALKKGHRWSQYKQCPRRSQPHASRTATSSRRTQWSVPVVMTAVKSS